MDKLARQGLYDLLTEVLNADIDDDWAFFRLTRFSHGNPQIEVGLRGLEYLERRPESELSDAILRAREATDE